MATEIRPKIVGLAGGTGSGKTTITKALLAHLGNDAVLLQHDWYYRDQGHLSLEERTRVNYDHPDAQETSLLIEHLMALRRGESIAAPQYDFATHTRHPDTRMVAPRPVILVEGINTLVSEELRHLFDLSIFVDVPADIRFIRRLQRDVAERGRSPESVTKQYLEQVRPMHEAFVEPCKARADLVLSGEADVAESVEKILARLGRTTIKSCSSPRFLLLSNSTMHGEPYLRWAQPHIAAQLEGIDEALFIPYAAVDIGFETYTAMLSEGIAKSDTAIIGIHTVGDKAEALKNAQCIIVGGGNTFALLAACQREGLMAPIGTAVRSGATYIGWSAGANLACPTIMTTNDMPIECPENFEGLGLIPFQINPHYRTESREGHGGESRDQRLKEFVRRNPSLGVLGLPEGMYISVADGESALCGDGKAMWFSDGREAEVVMPGRFTHCS
ncbi:MAG: dipeptidase PepE [Candidatus Hydrogenedentes bacterium]|nr:dipeptidase PepE [Candidatus Hydrogenedentota bacterium]